MYSQQLLEECNAGTASHRERAQGPFAVPCDGDSWTRVRVLLSALIPPGEVRLTTTRGGAGSYASQVLRWTAAELAELAADSVDHQES